MFGKVRFKEGIFGREFSEVTLNFLIFIYFIYLLSSKPYRTVIVRLARICPLHRRRKTEGDNRSTLKPVLSLTRDKKNLKLPHVTVFDKKQDRLLFSK